MFFKMSVIDYKIHTSVYRRIYCKELSQIYLADRHTLSTYSMKNRNYKEKHLHYHQMDHFQPISEILS